MARIAGVNIPQNKVVHVALTYIHGIGEKISNDICLKLNISKKKRTNSLTDDEILKVLRKVGDTTKKIDVDFEVGDMIKVIGGPFRGYTGEISEINLERGKLKSLLSIFGRETPVELEFEQVESVVK